MTDFTQKIEYRNLSWLEAAQVGIAILKADQCPEGDDPSALLSDSTIRTVFGIVSWVLEKQHVTEKQSVALQNIKHSCDAEVSRCMEAQSWGWNGIDIGDL